MSSEGVGTGAGDGATGQVTGAAWVNRSTDCPEAPAQAHPLGPDGFTRLAGDAAYDRLHGPDGHIQSVTPGRIPPAYGLTDADRADLHARLVSWFGDDRQAFLVSHLAPVIDRIKAEACAQATAEFQWNALEMARKADLATARAEAAEAEVERLLDDRECGRCSECQRGQRCTGVER
jgi:hypothetical protein